MTTVLPVIKRDTLFPAAQDMEDFNREDGDKEFIKVMMKRLKKENPAIAMFVEDFAFTERNKKGIMVCALMVYKLLENQSEINELEEMEYSE